MHITSEKTYTPNTELVTEFSHLVDLERTRLEKLNPYETLHRYTEYIIDGFLPLAISYYERIIL